jgi:hypothetical protein
MQYVLYAPRESLIGSNKEGLVSLIGLMFLFPE